MARYGQEFKDRAVARMLPPESAPVRQVSEDVGVSVATLERWLSAALSEGTDSSRRWTPEARLEAVVTTRPMNETELSAWCRTNGLYPQDIARWRASATGALADPQHRRIDQTQAKANRKRVRELERDLRRKEKALAETTALLVLRKKLSAIFPTDEGEDV